jgi:hypothetical protein
MKLITDRGEFDSLQMIRAAYLEAADRKQYRIPYDGSEWVKGSLHASDVGGCPRAAMYRLLGTPDKPRSASSKANRAVMFWAGYEFHFLTYSALSWAGILNCHERTVPLPEGWTGTLDAEIAQEDATYIFDEKTVLPNALNYSYSLPKTENCIQLCVYGDAVGNLNGLIEYTDRAGSNTPKECPIDLGLYVGEKDRRMKMLEECRDTLPELPPVLDQAYVPHYTRDGDYMIINTIAIETPWNCGYCDFHLTREERRVNPASGRMKKYDWTQPESTCKPPNAPAVDVAELAHGGIVKSCKSGHEQGVEAILSSVPLSYYAPQEEE